MKIHKIAKSDNNNLILPRINIKIIIYSDNIILIGHSLEETVMSRDKVNFLLQRLGFVINWKKFVLTSVQEIEFLGLKINSITLELSLNKTKIQKVVPECQNLLNNRQTSILELTRLIGLLTSTIQAVLPARLSCRFLQIQQISSLSESLFYLDKTVLNENSKIELKWWVQNLELCNSRPLIQPPADILIQTDASTKGWGGGRGGWGVGNMQWNLNRRDVVCSGNEKLYKCLRNFSHKTGYTNVLESLEAQSHSLPGRQHGSFDISIIDGGYPEFKSSQISKRNTGSSSPMWDHSYCRVPSQQTVCGSRLKVKKQFRLLGMEASSPVISENLSTEGNPRDRSVCFQIKIKINLIKT